MRYLPLVSFTLALSLLGGGCMNSAPANPPVTPMPPAEQPAIPAMDADMPTTTTTTTTTTTVPTATTTATPSKAVMKPAAKKPAVKTITVTIKDAAFSPQILAVNAGDTVIWTNKSAMNHTVTGQNNLWDSGNLKPGATYKRTFTAEGKYEYHCNIHPGMTGSVIVGKLLP